MYILDFRGFHEWLLVCLGIFRDFCFFALGEFRFFLGFFRGVPDFEVVHIIAKNTYRMNTFSRVDSNVHSEKAAAHAMAILPILYSSSSDAKSKGV